MRAMSRCVAFTAAMLLLQAGPLVAQDPIMLLRERAAPSIVKIDVTGMTPAGREFMFEGSGVILGSAQDLSIIVTAAHVIGHAGAWRTTANNEPDRKLRVWIPRGSGGALEPLPLPPTVAFQNDSSDFAILLVRGRFPGLAMGNPLQLVQGAQAVVMGYPLGAYDLRLSVGRGQLVAREAVGFALELSQTQTSEGQSGGPVLDTEGRVLGILSGALRQTPGTDLAIPITALQQSLATFLPPSTTGGAEQPLTIDAIVRVEVSGSGGGELSRTLSRETRLADNLLVQQPRLDNKVSIVARGGERSECKEESGQTQSLAEASGAVLREGADRIAIIVDLHARGGHYRTAVTCFLDQPIGLTGHDTMARAAASVQANFRVPVLDSRTRIRVTYEDLPQADSTIEVLDQEGHVIGTVHERARGEQDFAVQRAGLYTVRLSANSQARAEGGFGEQRVGMNARIGAIRVVPDELPR